MPNRSERIEYYVTPAQKREIQQLADETEQSLSAYTQTVMDRHLQEEALTTKARELDAERRLEELVTHARDELDATTDEMQDTTDEIAVHVIALWKLLKDDYGDVRQTEAMRDAKNTLQTDVDAPEPDEKPDDQAQGHSHQRDTDPPGNTDQSQTDDEDDEDWSWDFS